jgi:hypothetical protein
MIEDPIVEEVRRIRNEYARKFNYDMDAIFADIQQRQAQSGRTYVSFPPKRPEPVVTVPPVAPVDESARCSAAQTG